MDGMKFYRENDLKLQFDSSAWAPTLVRKGTGTTVAKINANTANSQARITTDNANQIVAIQCASYMARYMAIGSDEVFVCSGGVGTAYAYYIFDNPAGLTPLQSGETGIQFFVPGTNQLTYCSKYDMFTVAGTINDSQTVNLPSGGSYAIVAPDIAGHNRTTDYLLRDGTPWQEGADSDGLHNWSRRNDGKLSGVAVNGGTIQSDFVSFDDVIGTAGTHTSAPDPIRTWWEIPLVNALILDVTGF